MSLAYSNAPVLQNRGIPEHRARKSRRTLKVLIEILHPAQVHFFRFIIQLLQSEGHEVLVVTREKDVTIDLIKQMGWNYHCLSLRGNGLYGMGKELLSRYWRLYKVARRFRPDVMLGQTGVTIGLIGAWLGVPRLVLEEAEHARLQRAIGLPFATRIMTGAGYLGDHGERQVRFRGIWSQAYLDSQYFQPDSLRLKLAGINLARPYIVLRTVSWKAAHDAGKQGVTPEALEEAVARLSEYGRVIISTEGKLPDSLREYRNPVPVEDMHSLLAYCALYIGEGGSMAAEAAVLGRPAIFCSHLRCGFLLALEEKYDLLYNFNDFSRGVAKAEELLNSPYLQRDWQMKRRKLLDESEDIPAFVVNQIKQAVCA